MPFWYPVLPTAKLNEKNIHNIVFQGENLVCYKSINDDYVLHTDVCPHQGASFSKKGYLNSEGNLHCGYHGFEFENGTFCNIPDPTRSPKKFCSKIKLTTYPTQKKQDLLFFRPLSSMDSPEVFYPPEETNSHFRYVEGTRLLKNNYLTVCENLLDMLHISYVHSFGNRVNPIPLNVKSKKLSEYGFQTQFYYYPSKTSISNNIGKSPKVIVENEYHLPTNTITRVFAGPIIKTVFTRSIPIAEDRTLLYWKIYRNFWLDPYFPIFNIFGDWLIGFLMEKTIDEDVDILKNVYEESRKGPLVTKYDVTIGNFRKDIIKFTSNLSTEIIL